VRALDYGGLVFEDDKPSPLAEAMAAPWRDCLTVLKVCSKLLRGKALLEVFAHLVMALVFKTSGGFEQSSQWVRFPYTSVFRLSKSLFLCHSV
jgi:hypothetical protein